MNTSKITPTAMRANRISDVVTPAKTAIPAALALGLLGALLALTPPAIGKGQDQAAGQSAEGGLRKTPVNLLELPPYPTRIVTPLISAEYVGQKCVMTFRIDKKGRPYNICSTDVKDNLNLVTQLGLCLGEWRFEPAKDDSGNPVDRQVILPVSILPSKNGSAAQVAFAYAK